MIAIRTMMHKLRADQRGATAIEYGLICALIVIAMVGGASMLGGKSGAMWGKIQSNVEASM